MTDPSIIRRDKASRHTRESGVIYQGTITSVRDDGRVFVKVPSLRITLGPVMPINTTAVNRLKKNDTVVCAFTDEANSQLVVFGSAVVREDVFAASETGTSVYSSAAARDTSIPQPTEGRVVYLLDTDELQIYNGTVWITVIDTGNSENINVETLIAASASIGTLTVTGSSTLTVLGSSLLSASTTIGTISPTELGYLDGLTSGVQSQINAKSPSASPTFTGTVVLPSTTSVGTVSSAEIGYLDGVTSAIQTQIDTKAPAANPTFTGTVILPATTSIGTVSNTEIGYLDGVTSAIQTQINTKAPSASPTFTGIPTAPTAAAGTNTTQLATTAFVGAAVSVGMPTGAIIPFAGSAAPTGWLLCDGGSTGILRTTYAALFAVISTTYGSGDGSTTFNVPDLRGRVIAGQDNMGGVAANRLSASVSGVTGSTLGAVGGSQSLHGHNHTQNSHNHTQDSHNHTQNGHNHTQNGHAHSNSLNGTTTFAAAGHTHNSGSMLAAIGATSSSINRIGYVAGGVLSGPFATYTVQGTFSGSGESFNHNTPVYGDTGGNSANATVGINNTSTETATNVANTATNIASTATNQPQTATNNSTGDGASQNVQPTIILNYIIKA